MYDHENSNDILDLSQKKNFPGTIFHRFRVEWRTASGDDRIHSGFCINYLYNLQYASCAIMKNEPQPAGNVRSCWTI